MTKIADIQNTILNGLLTDGGHHKQAALEEALKQLVGEIHYNQLKAQYDWKEGIPG